VIYLASPYSHPERDIRVKRFETVARIAGQLMIEGHIVFSPICHTHPIAEFCDLPTGWEFWERVDRAYLSKCKKLLVLQIPGWDTSIGIAAEIRIAQEIGIPIEYLIP
jgi:Domain of unknown function (DUF1937)